ncbi:hypothetical protein AHAS_Ahas05G0072600 [Arachis hypogaea]|uniref:RNase H type-1 domain-containing protein n=1 Tax=Arachis hypogaea TaxID=3818 RepID=A0A445D8R2_ARAHY|nr:hypothetical protein Ahy_A05g025464 [Arachis hypogaea]
MGFRRIIVEIDSAAVVSLLNGRKELGRHPNHIIRKVNELRRREWNIVFVQIYRKGNRSANYLAKLSMNSETDYVFWDLPPPEILSIL